MERIGEFTRRVTAPVSADTHTILGFTVQTTGTIPSRVLNTALPKITSLARSLGRLPRERLHLVHAYNRHLPARYKQALLLLYVHTLRSCGRSLPTALPHSTAQACKVPKISRGKQKRGAAMAAADAVPATRFAHKREPLSRLLPELRAGCTRVL